MGFCTELCIGAMNMPKRICLVLSAVTQDLHGTCLRPLCQPPFGLLTARLSVVAVVSLGVLG